MLTGWATCGIQRMAPLDMGSIARFWCYRAARPLVPASSGPSYALCIGLFFESCDSIYPFEQDSGRQDRPHRARRRVNAVAQHQLGAVGGGLDPRHRCGHIGRARHRLAVAMADSPPDAIKPNSACGSKRPTFRQGYRRLVRDPNPAPAPSARPGCGWRRRACGRSSADAGPRSRPRC